MVNWPVSKDAYAQYALATCNDDVHRWRERVAVSAEKGRSWTSKLPVVMTASQVGTGFMESNWPKSSARKL